MAMIMVEAIVLVPRPFVRISLQFAGKGQGSFILNLHQNLVDRCNQWGEACELPCRGFGAFVLSLIFGSSHFPPPVLLRVFLPFPFLGLLFSSQ